MNGRSVGWIHRFACAAIGINDSGSDVQPADTVVADIAYQQRAVFIKQDAVRLAELCFDAGSAIATETGDSGAGNRGDDARFPVHFANDVIVAFRNVDVALGVETQL